MMLSWSVITAICATIGAMMLLAHPFTILASALSAPIATLHPLIATGWVLDDRGHLPKAAGRIFSI